MLPWIAAALPREGLVLEEVSATGLAHVQTIQHWPTGEATTGPYYLTVFRKP